MEDFRRYLLFFFDLWSFVLLESLEHLLKSDIRQVLWEFYLKWISHQLTYLLIDFLRFNRVDICYKQIQFFHQSYTIKMSLVKQIFPSFREHTVPFAFIFIEINPLYHIFGENSQRTISFNLASLFKVFHGHNGLENMEIAKR